MKYRELNFLILLLAAACRKEFDHPPLEPVSDGAKMSIRQLKEKFNGLAAVYRFGDGDTNLYCTVTADETSGNFYKTIFVRDEEGGALQVKLLNSGGIFTGDAIRINLNRSWLVYASGMLYLDSVDIEKSVVKRSSGNAVSARVVKIDDILKYAGDPLNAASLQSQLVEINGVEFLPGQRGKPIADVVSRASLTYTIRECGGSQVAFENSGFANFAAHPTPSGNGKITGIISQYNNAISLSIRSYYDMQMNATPCLASPDPTAVTSPTFVIGVSTPSLSESFDAIASNMDFNGAGWINYNETGSVKWKGNVKAGTYKAVKASAYASYEINTIWLISPPVVYHSGQILSFKTGVEYWDAGHPDAIQAFISTNFNGSNFGSANWTAITTASLANGSEGNYTGPAGMKSSGDIQLSALPLLAGYSGNFFIAFRYFGNSKFDSNVYLDDLSVK
jgi:hypothetical protein